MHRLIALAVLLCVACGDKTTPPNGTPDAGPERPASLIVHSDWWESITAEYRVKSITVLLGDGSRFRQPLDADGIARFEDPAISGPQDITVVVAGENKVVAQTTLAVEGKEVWLRSGSAPVVSDLSQLASTLKGRVTNENGNVSNVRVVGRGFSGETFTSTGTFSVDVRGATGGQVAVFALGHTGIFANYGLLRDITVGGGRTVSDLVIPLDHPLDQRVPVALTNLEPYASVTGVHAIHLLGSEVLFTAGGTVTPSMEAWTVARTPPFDTMEVRLSVAAGSRERVESGQVVASRPLPAEGVASLALPKPMTLISPAPGTQDAPGSQPRSGLTLRWSADPAAHAVTVRMTSQQGEPELSWYVTAPANVGSFTPFVLPAEVTAQRELRAGRYIVDWSSRFLGAGHGYQALFTEAPPSDAPDAWNTETTGQVILQD